MGERIDQKIIERQSRIKEIENYVQEYFKEHEIGKDSSGYSTQGTILAGSFWENLNSEHMRPIKEIMDKKLKNKSLVDLGVGSHPNNIPGSWVSWLDSKVPFKKYTGVDIEKPLGNTEDMVERMVKKGIDASYVSDDMLRYITHLPDKSSNFFLGAIDSDVILEEKYWKYLAEEITRAIEDKGIIIDAGMSHIGFYLDKNKFKTIYIDDKMVGRKIFEKV